MAVVHKIITVYVSQKNNLIATIISIFEHLIKYV